VPTWIVSRAVALAEDRDATITLVAIAWLLTRRRRGSVMIPIVGARTQAQIRDNLASLEVELSEVDVAQLEEASRIEPGFPHDFGGARLAYGETFGFIDDQRRLLDPLA
jgi:aryl-alcohol dehydrogenase-like predicted oxidoreductase